MRACLVTRCISDSAYLTTQRRKKEIKKEKKKEKKGRKSVREGNEGIFIRICGEIPMRHGASLVNLQPFIFSIAAVALA